MASPCTCVLSPPPETELDESICRKLSPEQGFEYLDNVEHVANYEKTTMWPPTKSASRSWLLEDHHLAHVDEILDNDELTLRSCIRTFSRCVLVVSYLALFLPCRHNAAWQRQKDQSDRADAPLQSRWRVSLTIVGDPCVTQRLDWTARQKREQPLRAGSYTRSHG